MARFATLLHQCLNSIKKGSSKEISLASRAIGKYCLVTLTVSITMHPYANKLFDHIQSVGLLALTVGEGDNAREILTESIPTISQTLRSGSESSKISVLDIIFVN